MTYLQREQYSQLRLFTCLREQRTGSRDARSSRLRSRTKTHKRTQREERTYVRVCVYVHIYGHGSIYFQAGEREWYHFRSGFSFGPRVIRSRPVPVLARCAICHGLAGLSRSISSFVFLAVLFSSFLLYCWQFLHFLSNNFRTLAHIFGPQDASRLSWPKRNAFYFDFQRA